MVGTLYYTQIADINLIRQIIKINNSYIYTLIKMINGNII